MPLANDLLSLLADPETHEGLTLATESQLSTLRDAVAQGKARRRDGKAPSKFDGALLSQGGRVAYLIDGDIPNLLVDERLELTADLKV